MLLGREYAIWPMLSSFGGRNTAFMQIRRARPDDLQQVKPMLLDMGFVEDEAALERRFPAFCEHPDHHFFVAERDGVLLGYALVQDYGTHLRSGDSHRTAKLDDLYTLPHFRRQGVARALMNAVTDWARENPLRYVFWYANQREAGKTYQALGYQPSPSGQEGFDFYEIDLGDPAGRLPHPLRGS